MKLKYLLGGVAMVVTLFLGSPSVTQQPRSSHQGGVYEPKTYYFGLRTNAAPISYTDDDGNWKGYCHAFIETLKKQHPEKKIEIVPLTRGKRFTGQGDKGEKLNAECGPNTITEGRLRVELKENGRDGTFSEPFAWTGATALLLEKNISKLSNKLELQELKFGVLKGTTTKTLVEIIYPSLINKNFVLLNESKDGINKLLNEEIYAYFNDELILRVRLKQLQSQNTTDKYSILPQLLSHEQYGIVVYNISDEKNKQLLTDINNLLKKSEIGKFGSTKIKIFNNPYFQEFISSVSDKQPDNNLMYALVLVSAIVMIILIIWSQNKNISFIINSYFSRRRTQLNSPNPYADSLKTQSLQSTLPIQVINNNHFSPKNDNHQGDHMSERKTQINQNNSSIGVGYSEQVEASQLAANIHNYAPEQDLAQAAAKIQELLKQLEKSNPTATQQEKQAFVTAAIPQEEKSRILRTLQAGGEKALEKLLNNPYVDVTMAIVKEWQKG
jgi:ABC-type amino acid transport substrate-binding protein